MNFSEKFISGLKCTLFLTAATLTVLLSAVVIQPAAVSEAELSNALHSSVSAESPLVPVSNHEQNDCPGALYSSNNRSAVPLLTVRRNPEQLNCRPCRVAGIAPEIPELLLLFPVLDREQNSFYLIQKHNFISHSTPVRAGPQTV